MDETNPLGIEISPNTVIFQDGRGDRFYAMDFFEKYGVYVTITPFLLWGAEGKCLREFNFRNPANQIESSCFFAKWDEDTVLIAFSSWIYSFKMKTFVDIIQNNESSFVDVEKATKVITLNSDSIQSAIQSAISSIRIIRLKKLTNDLIAATKRRVNSIYIVSFSKCQLVRVLKDFVRPGFYTKIIVSKKYKENVLFVSGLHEDSGSNMEIKCAGVGMIDFQENKMIQKYRHKYKTISLTSYMDKRNDQEILICGRNTPGEAFELSCVSFLFYNSETGELLHRIKTSEFLKSKPGGGFKTVHTVHIIRNNYLVVGYESSPFEIAIFRLNKEIEFVTKIENHKCYKRLGLIFFQKEDRKGSEKKDILFFRSNGDEGTINSISNIPFYHDSSYVLEKQDLKERIEYLFDGYEEKEEHNLLYYYSIQLLDDHSLHVFKTFMV